MKLSIEQLKELRGLCNDSTVWASVLDELIAIREMKGDQVPVGEVVRVLRGLQRVSDVVWKGGQVPEAGTKLFTAPQKPVVLPSSEDCLSCDRHYVDGMKAGWNFHKEGDNQGFLDSIERVQKDMREASGMKDGE